MMWSYEKCSNLVIVGPHYVLFFYSRKSAREINYVKNFCEMMISNILCVCVSVWGHIFMRPTRSRNIPQLTDTSDSQYGDIELGQHCLR